MPNLLVVKISIETQRSPGRYPTRVSAVGGRSRGENLFDGLVLSTRYFFDALGASYSGDLLYRGGRSKGRYAASSGCVGGHTKGGGRACVAPCQKKKNSVCLPENACRSQMAAAFAAHLAGDRIDAQCAGSEPAERINPDMVRVMAEKGIDMQFRKTVPWSP